MKKLLIFLLLILLIFNCTSITFASVQSFNDGKALGAKDLAEFGQYRTGEYIIKHLQSINSSYLNNEKDVQDFINGYYEGYGINRPGTSGDIYSAKDMGASIGRTEGRIQAESDFQNDKAANSENGIRSKEELIREHNLYRLPSTSRDEFYYAYVDSFKNSYITRYTELLKDSSGVFPNTNSQTLAQSLGRLYGGAAAEDDYSKNLTSKWDRNLPSYTTLASQHNLGKLTASEQRAFYNLFKDEYKKSYESRYMQLLQGEIIGGSEGDAGSLGSAKGAELATENAKKAKEYGNPPNNIIPLSDSEILAKYGMSNVKLTYQRSFLLAFKDAYRKIYDQVYINTKTLTPEEIREREKEDQLSKLTEYEKAIQEKAPAWYSKGESSGTTEGEIAGKKDADEGLKKDWRRKRPSDSTIISKYGLDKAGYNETRAFLLGYDKGFEKAYESAFLDKITDQTNAPRDKGAGDGQSAGETYGAIRARADFQAGKNQDNSIKISDSEIISRYNLSKTDADYREGFLEGFKSAYKESYDSEFTAAMSEDATTKMSQGEAAGQIAGTELGQKDATADMMKGQAYDPEKNKPTESFLIKRYNLDKQNTVYKEDFIRAAMEAYVIAYDDTYKGMSIEETDNKTISEMIELAGGTITTDDGRMTVEIPGGVFYDRTLMSIETLNSSYLTNYGFVEASKPYKVSILNPNGNYDDTRKITISFEYYGKPKNNIGETEAGLPGNAFNAGVYKLEGNQWKYIDSKIVGDTVVVEVNPSTLTNDGNIFALILDKSHVYLHDIRGHWAKDEVNAMIRRGVITGYPDQSFKPDRPITRGEFLVLLSRHYNWNLSSTMGYGTRFTDHANFGFYATYVDYGASNGYIIGYPDGEFKAHRNISYREIDWIMQRITGNPSFTWQTYAKMMVNEKGVRSMSYSNMNGKITRAEFAYMVYMMDRWKY
ncbi:MAG: S-layer homology domain-containing protein [Tissierellia bacterium]|nr:S-layer homology domain-containing protein [Tissierellia bacterium]